MATIRRVEARRLDFPLLYDRILKKIQRGYPWVNPETNFRFSNYHDSTGTTTGYGHVAITFGHDEKDAMYIIVHELTHAAHPRLHHTEAFFLRRFALGKYVGEDMKHAVSRESRYMKRGAPKAARRMRLIKKEL